MPIYRLQVNKFEQVWGAGLGPKGRGPGSVCPNMGMGPELGGVQLNKYEHVSSYMGTPYEQTVATDNNSFPDIRMRAVKSEWP